MNVSFLYFTGCHLPPMRNAFMLMLLIIAAIADASAQRRYLFEHLTAKDGLSQGSVNCILQDSAGFMWFGTQDGLNRYDGYELKVFKSNRADSTTLNDSWIISIAEDREGVLWIGTLKDPGVLNRFDRTTESFARIARDSVDLTGARRSIVAWDYEQPDGIRWHGTNGGGVTRFDPATGKTITYTHNAEDPFSLIDNRVLYIYGDRLGVIWIGTKGGLDRLDVRSGKFRHFTHDPKNPRSLSNNWVWPIFEDRRGVLWVGTYGGGLNRFDRRTETFTRFRHIDSDPRSLNGDQLLSLYQSRSGLIWVGTDQQGVDRFHPEIDAFIHYMNDPSDPTSLSDNNVFCMFVDGNGGTWIGTKAGVDRFNRATGTFTHYMHNPSDPRSLGDNLAQCFLEDRNGSIWIGLRTGGLDRFDPGTGVFTHYRNDPNNPTSLSDNGVYALCEDRDGGLWVGTHKGGLNYFDPGTGRFTRYVHRADDPGSLGAEGVWALCEDNEGTLWVGTFGGGLDKLDRDSGTFTHFRHDDTPGSLSDNIVAFVYEDRALTLWVGTPAGLNRLDRRAGTFTHYREKDGLPNEALFGILEDDHGRLWLSTNKGISRFDPGEESFRNYDYNDGLQGDEFNLNACARDPRTGEMYFGGSGGFNLFHPDSIRENMYVPPVVFSSFTRYNTDDEEGKPIIEKGIDAKPAITLSYKDNVANLEFAALSFYNSFKNRYAYKLEGYSENWIQLGTERRATFTNLDAGDYRLLVRGSNNSGIWNERGAVLAFTVTPPWWKTTWAYLSYVVIALGFLYGLRRFEIGRREQKAKMRESELRTKAVEAEKRALQAENERKTKELEEARVLQLSMLPKEIPELPNADIAVFMKTATEVGGDYYDFKPGPDGELNIAFGDATGHGMQAGTIVTLMKGLFTSDASRLDIQTFFNHSSRAIKDIKLGRLLMAFSLLKIRGNKVTMSSAGMPPIYWFRKNPGEIEEIMLKGMPLGAMKSFPYVFREEELHSGDVLLLLSDGLPEQKNAQGEMFDYARVQELLREVVEDGPEAIIRHLVQAGEGWMNGTPQDDDITMLALKIR